MAVLERLDVVRAWWACPLGRGSSEVPVKSLPSRRFTPANAAPAEAGLPSIYRFRCTLQQVNGIRTAVGERVTHNSVGEWDC